MSKEILMTKSEMARLVRRVGCAHQPLDRKSTRLNSSHVEISYAVFCLKKKKTELQARRDHVARLLVAKYSDTVSQSLALALETESYQKQQNHAKDIVYAEQALKTDTKK